MHMELYDFASQGEDLISSLDQIWLLSEVVGAADVGNPNSTAVINDLLKIGRRGAHKDALACRSSERDKKSDQDARI